MKKRRLKLTVLATFLGAGAAVFPGSNVYAAEVNEIYNADTDPCFENDMELYCQYVESHELSDYLDGRDGIFGDISSSDIFAEKVKVADFDGDNRVEVWVTGPSAAANNIAGILDISNGEVRCVFNGWGSEVGRYTDPQTGKTGLVIYEGNTEGEEDCHLRESLYDVDWNNAAILYEMQGSQLEDTMTYTAYTDGGQRQLTMQEYSDETENLKNSCIKTEAVAETKRETGDEIPHMDKQQVLEFLQEVLSPGSSENSDPSQDSPITSYPKYDEIIRQYYNGVNANWSMSDYSDRNLCYLAGYETSSSDLGYCTMDIDGDGIEELMIGSVNADADTSMFFDLYTMVNGQRSLVISSGERDRYYLCEDHTIANEASGGAMSSSFKYYDLVSGQLQIKENVFLDGFDHPENPWFYTTTEDCTDYSTPISEEEGQNIRGKYSYMNIPYVSLSEIGSQTVSETTQPETSSYRQQAEESVKTAEQKASSALTGSEQYEIWDNCLNEIWSYLQEALSSEDMDALTQEELDWITGKENIINSAENPSAEETLIKVAEITKERVYELLDRLS